MMTAPKHVHGSDWKDMLYLTNLRQKKVKSININLEYIYADVSWCGAHAAAHNVLRRCCFVAGREREPTATSVTKVRSS